MKLGIFIAAALCVAASNVHATPLDEQLVARATARSAVRDHAGAIELYRQAYELESKPHLLTLIAHEYRSAGNSREALAYFCSYIYVDAAGDDADDASTQARAIAVELGRPATSDREACSPNAVAVKPVAVTARETLAVAPPKLSRISKREVAGLSLLVVSIASFGVGLYDGRELAKVRADQAVDAPGADQDALAAREHSLALQQKLVLGIGGATIITGGILYLTGRTDRHKADRALIGPTVSKSGAGLVLTRPF